MSACMTALCKATAQPQTNLPQMPSKPGVNACRMHVHGPSCGAQKELSQIPALLLWTPFFFFVFFLLVTSLSHRLELLPTNCYTTVIFCILYVIYTRKQKKSLCLHYSGMFGAHPKQLTVHCCLDVYFHLIFRTATVDNPIKTRKKIKKSYILRFSQPFCSLPATANTLPPTQTSLTTPTNGVRQGSEPLH